MGPGDDEYDNSGEAYEADVDAVYGLDEAEDEEDEVEEDNNETDAEDE